MATRIKPGTRHRYEQDFYAWAKAQADLLRAGHYSDLDLEHLIEEVDDLGESLYRSARSRIRTIIEHLLKLEHSPARDPRAGWVGTVMTQRSDLEDELTASLRPRLGQALPRTYDQARRNCRGDDSRGRRERRGRRAARDLPLQPRSDRRPLAALRLDIAADWLAGAAPPRCVAGRVNTGDYAACTLAIA
jgi:hypothetical protein